MPQQGLIAEGDDGRVLVYECFDVSVVDLLGTDDHVVEFCHVVPLPGDAALGDAGVPLPDAFFQGLIEIVLALYYKGQMVAVIAFGSQGDTGDHMV